MVSLAAFVAASGFCDAWPDETFVFSMNRVCTLTVRTRSSPRPPRGAPASSRRPRAQPPIADGVQLDATCACEAIHAAIARLPRYMAPSQVPFSNGLYFFLESGEESAHGRPRITRIGNHPRVQGRLVGRLGDHYATRPNAKNGSVFRRYLGGALLRRDGNEQCLAPGPGLGHWELGTGRECERCVEYEERVTARLRDSFAFACVRIDDQELRNRLERRFIASVAQCDTCRPSADWLGAYAYPRQVRSTGLWNSNHIDDPPATDVDIDTFRILAREGGVQDLADSLLLIPCSKGKRGTDLTSMATCSITDFLGPEAVRVLAEGRFEALKRAKLDHTSESVAAVLRYSGQPYKTEGVCRGYLMRSTADSMYWSCRADTASCAQKRRSRTTRPQCRERERYGVLEFPLSSATMSSATR